jgi:hypothetical protein
VNEVIHQEIVGLKELISSKLNKLDEIKVKMKELYEQGVQVKSELVEHKAELDDLSSMKSESENLEHLHHGSRISESDHELPENLHTPSDFELSEFSEPSRSDDFDIQSPHTPHEALPHEALPHEAPYALPSDNLSDEPLHAPVVAEDIHPEALAVPMSDNVAKPIQSTPSNVAVTAMPAVPNVAQPEFQFPLDSQSNQSDAEFNAVRPQDERARPFGGSIRQRRRAYRRRSLRR